MAGAVRGVPSAGRGLRNIDRLLGVLSRWKEALQPASRMRTSARLLGRRDLSMQIQPPPGLTSML